MEMREKNAIKSVQVFALAPTLQQSRRAKVHHDGPQSIIDPVATISTASRVECVRRAYTGELIHYLLL